MEAAAIMLMSIAILLETIVLSRRCDRSRRHQRRALPGAAVLLAIPVTASIVLRHGLSARAWLALGGMCVFSGLVWRWWKHGVAPERWAAGEVGLAVLATIMFSLANGAFASPSS